MNSIAKRFAVIGKPVFHSKSPQIFNAWFDFHNIDAHYNRITIEGNFTVDDIFEKLDLSFANITTPFKEQFFNQLHNVSDVAKMVRAVNTIYRTPDGLVGDNTDGDGVVGALSMAVSDFKQKALVIGAGPAARSAALALKKSGSDVWIANRTYEKVIGFAKSLQINIFPFSSLFGDLTKFRIIVLATSPDFNPLAEAKVSNQTVVLNANYRGKPLQHQLSMGTMIGGEQWLVYQAIAAFEKYFHFIPDKTSIEPFLSQSFSDKPFSVALLSDNERVLDWEAKENIVLYRNGLKEKAQRWVEEEFDLLTKH